MKTQKLVLICRYSKEGRRIIQIIQSSIGTFLRKELQNGAARYIRLSKEDEGEGPSENVNNQQSLLNEFVRRHRRRGGLHRQRHLFIKVSDFSAAGLYKTAVLYKLPAREQYIILPCGKPQIQDRSMKP